MKIKDLPKHERPREKLVSLGVCNLKDKELKIKDSKYYVVGTGIDDYGDAHSEKGFCNAIRKADIQGKVRDNKFHITYFKLR